MSQPDQPESKSSKHAHLVSPTTPAKPPAPHSPPRGAAHINPEQVTRITELLNMFLPLK